MLTLPQKLAILHWWRRRVRPRRKRRYYVRPAHRSRIEDSFTIFNRYYESADPTDLIAFCRCSHAQFDELSNLIAPNLPRHARTHLRPINQQQRLVVFLR
jgi:hypothetical protein